MDFKKDGSDYFLHHCVVVANHLIKNKHNFIGANHWKSMFIQEIFDKMIAAAYLHDVLEDTNETLENFDNTVVSIVKELTKKEETYFDYINRLTCINNCTIKCAAIAIKLADLECNMSTLKEGSLKDKYRFAHHVLLRYINE